VALILAAAPLSRRSFMVSSLLSIFAATINTVIPLCITKRVKVRQFL
jgi:hypothetical protein